MVYNAPLKYKLIQPIAEQVKKPTTPKIAALTAKLKSPFTTSYKSNIN